MGGCEPGQARDRAAISGYYHVPGVLVESRFFYGSVSRNCLFSFLAEVLGFWYNLKHA